jgi:hypothetical protein
MESCDTDEMRDTFGRPEDMLFGDDLLHDIGNRLNMHLNIAVTRIRDYVVCAPVQVSATG